MLLTGPFLPLSMLLLLLSPLTLARPPIPFDKAGYPRLRLPREPTLSVFTGALGDLPVPAITSSGNPSFPFLVAGTPVATFAKAVQHSCDMQHEACAAAVREGARTFDAEDCSRQDVACLAMQRSAPVKCFWEVDCEAAEEKARLRVQERERGFSG
ncbi:hypothetical protein MMC34_000932 [Xylographa carneopallida]|nr:hypothetical protein [Xylographa carneopallida]